MCIWSLANTRNRSLTVKVCKNLQIYSAIWYISPRFNNSTVDTKNLCKHIFQFYPILDTLIYISDIKKVLLLARTGQIFLNVVI
jgi:hypothetical protein